MFDIGLALKIAGGGFAMVFMLLILIWFTVWLTRVVVEKIEKIKNN